jgi:tRNA 5-methylaminomethyl-2-thiouridine biosynthesis bifunctional protein
MINSSTILWQNNTPVSSIYEDLYYSNKDGFDEAYYVFVKSNDLEKRLKNNDKDFYITETGFGTGLNFLIVCKLWHDLNLGCKLYFTSIEKHPLDIIDIKKAILSWPQLEPYMSELEKHYPKNTEKQFTASLFNDRINLNIYFKDISNLKSDDFPLTDAWFMDGFAPSKNPAMWTDHLYKTMYLKTNKGGTCSSFTAAGAVRRGLEEAGFKVVKIKGFGNKRHMITGYV